MSEEHLPGAWSAIKEHKFTIITVIGILTAWMITGHVHEIVLILAALPLGICWLLGLFFDFPNSRFLLLRIIGTLAWGSAFISALLMGWTRWVSFD